MGILALFRLYIINMKDDLIDFNLSSLKSGSASQVYFLDKDGKFNKYATISKSTNRIWVDFDKIPKHMKDVIVSIEDKRFYKHGGVDFVRTAGATIKALIGKKEYGGSTITQQLVKNVTEDNKATFDRKIREIGRAFRLEDRMSKDEILEFYLNIVNFGAGTSGVGAAAKVYFNKKIEDCNLAECASIAVITKNPSKYNPITHPEENKKRREMAINEMLKQNKITKDEFEKSMNDSKNLKISNNYLGSCKSSSVRNWYLESLCSEIANDLSSKYNIRKELAEEILYSGNLQIYACVDPHAQDIAEKALKNCSSKDKDLELGYVMMDYNGRILAILGSSKPKTMNSVYNRAVSALRQPGSTMKPLSTYALAIDSDTFTYSSKINDEPLKIDGDGSGTKKEWPKNWYKKYNGPVTLQWAVEKSANAPVAQILNSLGLSKSFKFLSERLGLSHLDSSDSTSFAALATGGTHSGVTPLELASAYQIFGNGGKFYKPTTYFYVTNKNGNVILDNRNPSFKQVIREDSSYVMNRLLRQVIIGKEGTGRGAHIEDWEVVGKTGTTNNDYDSWFVGLSPVCLASIWTGHDKQKKIEDTGFAIRFWKYIMQSYLDLIDYDHSFKKPESVKTYAYCTHSGYLANQNCPDKAIGYYCSSNVPPYCYLHSGTEFANPEFTIDSNSFSDDLSFLDPRLEESSDSDLDSFFYENLD